MIRRFILVLMALMLLISIPCGVEAKKKKAPSSGGSVTYDNDGLEMKDPYGDSNIPSSFADLDYYDCYVPYNLTPRLIGGWSQGTIWSWYSTYSQPMTEMAKDFKISAYVTQEGDMSSSAMGSAKKSYESGTNLTMYTDANGTSYYVMAIQKFYYNAPKAGKDGFPGWGANRGQIVDLIMLDGTVLHMAIGDNNASEHTNGASDEQSRLDCQYDFTKLLMPQYKNLFQAQTGNSVEIWGAGSAAQSFTNTYNMGSGEGKNRVVYYRMYNGFVRDNPKRASGIDKGVKYSLGDVDVKKGNKNNKSTSSNSSSENSAELLSEWDLIGMPSDDKMSDDQSDIVLPALKDLSSKEAKVSLQVRDDISLSKKALTYDNARVAVVFVGLCFITYAMFLFMALLFDKSNQFLDISFVKVLTFGRLEYSDEVEVQGEYWYASTSRIIVVSVVIFVVGLLVVSGVMLPFMMELVYRGIGKFL